MRTPNVLPDELCGQEDAGREPLRAQAAQPVPKMAPLPTPVSDPVAGASPWAGHPQLGAALAASANPYRAAAGFERMLRMAPHPDALLSYLSSTPHALEAVVIVFCASQFLTEILLSELDDLPGVLQADWRKARKTAQQHYSEARAAVRTGGAPDSGDALAAPLDALRRYHRRELLGIGLADLCGLVDLPSTTQQLSYLADALVQICLELQVANLGVASTGFAVLALGKLGGEELNYSSDVDLVFVARDDANFFRRLAERLIRALTEATGSGFLYRVDMRLRPWGRVGPLVPTVNGYLSYLQEHARLWEKQALLKARAIAGDRDLGVDFLSRVQPLLFGAAPGVIRADVRAMKQRTEDHLRLTGRDWGEVKLGEGSIRDVEFVAQYLQLVHGEAHRELRTGNTLEALARLTAGGYLAAEESRVLTEGYTFLRTVEHYLQLLDYRQTHSLPTAEEDLRYLARRLGFQGLDAADSFLLRYRQHSAAVRAIYMRHLVSPAPGHNLTVRGGAEGAKAMALMRLQPNGASLQHAGETAARSAAPERYGAMSFDLVQRHLARLTPSYGTTFAPEEIEKHAAMAMRLDGAHPIEVEAEELDPGYWRVTIVGHDYLGELSLICGLLFASGFSIVDGHVYTYEPPTSGIDARRKIVDVFTVRSVMAASPEGSEPMENVWIRYAGDLTGLVRHLQVREPQTAQGELAKRVAVAVREVAGAAPTLHPIDIEIDNAADARYTVLRIDAPDTIGFLYEFTNALALNGIHIAQVAVSSLGNWVHDTLYVTDSRGLKIDSLARQRELRAATVLVKHFTHLLPRSPNPEAALLHFNEYLGELFARASWPDELASLERPEVLDALAKLLGVSEFLWDDFLRMQYANLFPVVRDVATPKEGKSKADLRSELAALLEAEHNGAPKAGLLNAFKDREMFRIDMRHILGHIKEFSQFSAELTDLAEIALEAATGLASEGLHSQHGIPLTSAGDNARLCLLALGKCGGRELGYASDIELMFVYDGRGQTTGPRVTTTAEFYEKLVVETVRTVRARREGIFEIDLQLRPYGKSGSLAVSLDSFRRYFAPEGGAWQYERQALIKLRPIAGDLSLGAEVLSLRDAFVYGGEPFDVAALRALRERQLRHLVTPGTVNAKFGQGGLVDTEYVVQALQISHGRDNGGIRSPNTIEAMSALASAGFISGENFARLRNAHSFLEQLINALRVVRGNNKDLTVPAEDSEEFAFLARRLGYGNEPLRLSADLALHLDWVQKLSRRLLGE